MTDAPTGPGGGPAGAGEPGAAAPGAGDGATTATAQWPRKAADAVDLVVDTIHDKAVRPAMLAARAVVFGMLAAVLALVVLVLLSVGLVRLLDVYAFGNRVWISYAVLGGIFTAAGFLAWSRRTAPEGR